MLDLSVVIVACNEERIIGQTLQAVASFASEIILVDSGSSDLTIEIAKQYNALCHHQQWLGYTGQKNFALSLATKSWILSLDADEVVTEKLRQEIVAKLNTTENSLDRTSVNQTSLEQTFVAYRIPRLLYIGDKPLKHGGFYPDSQLRLFKNGSGQFIERKVHESVKVNGPVGQLKSPLLHYAYISFEDYALTLDQYARLSAEEFSQRVALKKNNSSTRFSKYWRRSKLNEALHPLWTFFYRYLIRGGFLDGCTGLKANWFYKDYVRKKISYSRQIELLLP